MLTRTATQGLLYVSVKWSRRAIIDPITALPDLKICEFICRNSFIPTLRYACLASQTASQPARQVAPAAISLHISRKKYRANQVRIRRPRLRAFPQSVRCASPCRPQNLLPSSSLNTRFTEYPPPRLFSADQSVTLCTVSSTTASYPSMGFGPLQGISLISLCPPA